MSLLIQLKVKNMIFLNKKMSLKNKIFIGYLLVYMENFFFFFLVIRAIQKQYFTGTPGKLFWGPNLNKQQVKMKVNFYENATCA